jgi:hypothetical protein
MPGNYFKSGEWNVYCMVCNRKIKSGLMMKRWDGLLVCPDDYENRHPMDFLRSRQERISVPFSSDTSFNQFTDVTYPTYPYCNAEGSSGVPALAIAGCMRPGVGFPNGLPVTPVEIPDEPPVTYFELMSGGNLNKMDGTQLVYVST